MHDIQFDAELVNKFSDSLLRPRYDSPLETPKFHEELWGLCTLPDKLVAVAAPRGHAKSTSVTHAYTLANICFRQRSFIIIISDTEAQASNFLGDIKAELTENEDLKSLFGVARIIKDNETDCILQYEDGKKCRIIAKGAGQKLRGMKWLGKRPDLIVIDDLENDDLVENPERREKLRMWFFKAVMPSLSPKGIIRYVGTILHLDALLERVLNDPTWVSKRYKAHNEDYTEILWPELHTKETLQAIQQSYVTQGMPEGYSCEYLNNPIDVENRLFRDRDFKEMPVEALNKPLVYYCGTDFAASQKEKADYTVIVVGGMDSEGNLHIVDVVRDRFESDEMVEIILDYQQRYNPELFLFETEKIDKILGPFLRKRMQERNVYPIIEDATPTKDKISRARSIAARMRQGSVYFHKDNEWYTTFYDELSTVTRSGVKSAHDDQLDAFAWLGYAIDKFWNAPTLQEIDDEEYEDELWDYGELGVDDCTGY